MSHMIIANAASLVPLGRLHNLNINLQTLTGGNYLVITWLKKNNANNRREAGGFIQRKIIMKFTWTHQMPDDETTCRETSKHEKQTHERMASTEPISNLIHLTVLSALVLCGINYQYQSVQSLLLPRLQLNHADTSKAVSNIK